MVDIPTISIVIATTSVVAGVIYYSFMLRNQAKARQMDLLMRLYLTWGSEDMKKAFGRFMALKIKDYDDFVKNYGPLFPAERERSQAWEDIDRIGWFFNGIGFLVHGKFADTKQVEDLIGYGVIIVWERMKPLVYGWRKQYNIPKSFGWFEYLANEMKKREQTLQPQAA